MKDGVDAGKKLEDLQGSIKLSAAVDTWVGEKSLKNQIKDAYQEITQGKPRGEIQ